MRASIAMIQAKAGSSTFTIPVAAGSAPGRHGCFAPSAIAAPGSR
jgi:hypothetical protein